MKKSLTIPLFLFLVMVTMQLGAQKTATQKLSVLIGGHVIEESDAWKYIINNFKNQYNVDVDYQLVGFEGYRDKLVTSFASGIPMDVVLCNLIGDTADFASRGWLEPIDNRLAAWEGTAQIWPKLWEAVTYQDKRYGIPWYTDARLLMYNYDLFEKAGLDPKKPPQTWEELRAYAKKITAPAKGVYGYGVSGASSLITTCAYYTITL